MNKLKNTICYLCGPMDRVDDGGVGWRSSITPLLKDMGVGVLDPCNKPTQFAVEDDGFRDQIESLKQKGEFFRVKELMRDIAAIDLRMVDIAHFLVMYMDLNAHSCGSYHEAFVSIQQKKPLLVMCKQGKAKCPNWLFGVMPHEHMFGAWDSLLEYLKNVNKGKDTKDYNRWRFFDFEKIYSE